MTDRPSDLMRLFASNPNAVQAAEAVLVLARELQPLCRSITGDGVRQTLQVLAREIPLTIHEVPSGTEVLDWTVPREWNIRDAYVKDQQGRRLVDFRECSLHVMSYSVPVQAAMTRAELEPHLHSQPDRPRAIPYKTSYYRENWGFCLSQEQRDRLGPGPFEVCIDSTLSPGSLTYGEFAVEGSETGEFLVSTHCCHPYMANDNLSGMVLALQLAKRLREARPRLTYRFLFIPVTIGSITWLARNEHRLSAVRGGLVLTCLGDRGGFTYKKTRRGNAEIDRVAANVLREAQQPHCLVDFVPYGYDERQYNSPGFNLPVGTLMRTPNGCYPEYHTSDDNLELLCPEALGGSFETLWNIIQTFDGNGYYRNLRPCGEPQLGKRGLYDRSLADTMPLLWVLNLSDGAHSLLDIAERAGLSFTAVAGAAERLVAAGLLERLAGSPGTRAGEGSTGERQGQGGSAHGS